MFQIPLHALIIMVGPSGSGKSTFVKKYFQPFEVVSSDAIREELTGDLRNQHVNDVVFQEFNRRIEIKLRLGERVVADAMNLRKKDRTRVAHIGANMRIPVFYVVVNRSLEEKLETADWRSQNLIEKTQETFKGQEKDILSGDNMSTIIDTRVSEEEGAEEVDVVQKFDFNNFTQEIIDAGYKGIDIIGDVHGMTEDFQRLVTHATRKNHFIVQLGDVVDYGPDSVGCVELMYKIGMYGRGLFIIGNHERKLERYLRQKKEGNIRVQVKGGIKSTVKQLDELSPQKFEHFEQRFGALMYHARHHATVTIGDERIMFVHAAASPQMWDLVTPRLTGFNENRAVFGQIDKDMPRLEDGYPNRIYDWVDDIPEGDTVYVGHDIQDMKVPHTKNGKLGGKAVFVDTGSGKDGVLSVIDRKFDTKK